MKKLNACIGAILIAAYFISGMACAAESGAMSAHGIVPGSASVTTTQIHASGEARTTVQNDVLTISLMRVREGTDAASLHKAVAAEAAHALATARKVTVVKVRTEGYGVYPVYDKGRIVRQRARYSLSLKTRDVSAGLALAAKLLPFQVQNLRFSVSPEKRKETEKRLIKAAIEDMRGKFAIAARALGDKGFVITQVSIGGPPFSPMPQQRVRMAGAMARESATVVPAEAGESRVVVTVSGTARTQ